MPPFDRFGLIEMPLEYSALAIKLTDTVVGGLLRAATQAKVAQYFKDKANKKAFQDCVSQSLEVFAQKHQELTDAFFDETFLMGPAASEIQKFLSLTNEPSAEILAHAFARQFSQPVPDILYACKDFLEVLSSNLIQEPRLVELINNRLIRDISRQLRKAVNSIEAPSPPKEVGSLNLTELNREFQIASAEVSGWQRTLGEGQYIDRPELSTLTNKILSNEARIYALLGAPGAGKSALMASLYERSQNENILCLAIKADALPLDVYRQRV